MNKILCAYDFSPLSKKALITAHAFSKVYQAELYVLNVIQLPSDTSFLSGNIQLRKNEVGKRIKEYLSSNGISANVIVEDTKLPVSQFILEKAMEIRADMIALGKCSVESVEEHFVGSTVLNLKKISDIPLLIATYEERTTFKNVVVPVSEKPESFTSLPFAIDFCKRADCRMFILHVFETAGFEFTAIEEERIRDIILENLKPYMDSAQASLSGLNYTIQIVAGESAGKGIVDFSREVEADLIIMARRRRLSLMERLFYSSNAYKVLRSSFVPVVLI